MKRTIMPREYEWSQRNNNSYWITALASASDTNINCWSSVCVWRAVTVRVIVVTIRPFWANGQPNKPSADDQACLADIISSLTCLFFFYVSEVMSVVHWVNCWSACRRGHIKCPSTVNTSLEIVSSFLLWGDWGCPLILKRKRQRASSGSPLIKKEDNFLRTT